MGKSKSHPQFIETAKRRAFVLRMRLTGMTMRQIEAAAVEHYGREKLPKGWDSLYVAKDIKREMDRVRAEISDSVNEIRELELQRIDDLFVTAYGQAKSGSMPAVDRCIKLMERRSKLLGLDLPIQHELMGKGGGPIEVTEVIVELVEEENADSSDASET